MQHDDVEPVMENYLGCNDVVPTNLNFGFLLDEELVFDFDVDQDHSEG